ncbi:MAG: rhodanese-like domain-containing protein [Bacteroidota bacterium]|nr:rhodanese-like domain-containing protein [Bacteroidota bacterium]
MTLREIVKNPRTKFIDVRTEQEFAMAHLNGAINIPLHTIPSKVEEIKRLDAESIVFYCLSGNRSGQAVSFLKQNGMQNIYNGGSIDEINYLLN